MICTSGHLKPSICIDQFFIHPSIYPSLHRPSIHLGDYEATVFSKFSHNRAFGEAFVKGETFENLAEGYATSRALVMLSEKTGVDLPICGAVYRILHEGSDPRVELDKLFKREIKREFNE